MICLRCGADDIDPVDDTFPPKPNRASYVTIHPTVSSELTAGLDKHLVGIICDRCLAKAVLMDSIYEVDTWVANGAIVAVLAKQADDAVD